MSMHEIDAYIARRLLVNFRVDADVAQTVLPKPFWPRLVGDRAIIGACLIHLHQARPAGFPAFVGVDTQGLAHRIAVTYPDASAVEQNGVYIPRRDSGSWVVNAVGKSLVMHRASFVITEDANNFDISVQSQDGGGSLRVKGRTTDQLTDSVFSTVDAAREFFQFGGPGYSPVDSRFTGVSLQAQDWTMVPVKLDEVDLCWFGERGWPAGSWEFDSALVMGKTNSAWRAVPDILGA